MRAERDLLRQLVPVISPAADGRGGLGAGTGARTALDLATTVHDPRPKRPRLPDDYTIEDANEDFFD